MLIPILQELGLISLWHSSLDTKLLCSQRFVRLFAYGGSTLILASYLSTLGISDDRIGLFMTLTLVGDVVISFFLTLFADRLGRKAVLLLGSAMMCGSGVAFAWSGNYWVLLLAAILGVISPNGNEIGPFRAVEESTIAHLTAKEHMSDIYAWYSLIGTAGTALGMMVCGWVMSILQETKRWDFIPACRVVFMLYAAVGAVKFVLTMGLSSNVEAGKKEQPDNAGTSNETDPLLGSSQIDETVVTPKQKRLFFLPGVEAQFVGLVTSLFLLFALDSFGSALASLSWVTYYFRRKFNMTDGELGSLFSGTSVIQAISMLLASSIAKRFGNVKTMVFTHLPSGLFLALMSVPNSLPIAMIFLIGRACLQNMDVAPRSAFLAQALPAEQRTAIMGTINVVKTTSASLAPLLTGVLSSRGALGVSFVVAGCLKISYDLGMLITFGGMDREHQRKAQVEAEADA
ncbi:MFS transporter, putative [Talaromyces stipitatus ATCC 10500]|uniref:MFS transporter, putative n=1 Tax=Talaromyces stipitatus (strain ATCC 10500 / CBS 375.48 / QM 6759 / NRRL 1006) TaxID=441959 RepID=B8MNX0_TALSN|nr:MFS transporter, putative [Talaromyces stipitatus ATCC 10500]EED14209.1 MFS transporter, putative [Talaromyces stipitatus ATCC 10500]